MVDLWFEGFIGVKGVQFKDLLVLWLLVVLQLVCVIERFVDGYSLDDIFVKL